MAKKKVNTAPKSGRRPTRYTDWLDNDSLTKLAAWARDGLTNEQIANNIGISTSTLYAWRQKHPQIEESLKKGQEVVDIEVENALLKKALGYSVKETKVEETDEGKKVTTTVKHIAGDTTAQIFWLKNRKPDTWRDRRDYNTSAKVETDSPFMKTLKNAFESEDLEVDEDLEVKEDGEGANNDN